MKKMILVNEFGVRLYFYNKRPVVTLETVDKLHGRPPGTAKHSFKRHRDKMIEGEDFYVVPYDEWKAFGGVFNTPPKTGKGGHTGSRIFLTENGYLMVIKPFTDDLAWQVQRALVNAYFTRKQAPDPITEHEIRTMRNMILNLVGTAETAKRCGRAESTVRKYTKEERSEVRPC